MNTAKGRNSLVPPPPPPPPQGEESKLSQTGVESFPSVGSKKKGTRIQPVSTVGTESDRRKSLMRTSVARDARRTLPFSQV